LFAQNLNNTLQVFTTCIRYRREVFVQKSTKDKYIETSLELLTQQLAREGVIIRNNENLTKAVLEIGELYYDLKRKEDLI